MIYANNKEITCSYCGKPFDKDTGLIIEQGKYHFCNAQCIMDYMDKNNLGLGIIVK